MEWTGGRTEERKEVFLSEIPAASSNQRCSCTLFQSPRRLKKPYKDVFKLIQILLFHKCDFLLSCSLLEVNLLFIPAVSRCCFLLGHRFVKLIVEVMQANCKPIALASCTTDVRFFWQSPQY